MKRKFFHPVMIVIFVFILGVQTTSAGIFQTAGALRRGHWGVGLEPVIITEPSDFVFFLHGGYGIAYSKDLRFKLGIGGENLYFGSEFKADLLPDRPGQPGISTILGLHTNGDIGFDFAFIVSNHFRAIAPYLAVDGNIELLDENTSLPINLVLGSKFYLTRKKYFLIEVGLDIHESSSYLSGGLLWEL